MFSYKEDFLKVYHLSKELSEMRSHLCSYLEEGSEKKSYLIQLGTDTRILME